LGLTELNDPAVFASVIAGRGRKFDGLYIGCPETVQIGAILDQLRAPARCVTFDLTEVVKPFLQQGTVAAVIDSSRYHQGYVAVQKAFECLQTNSLESAWVPIPSTVLLPAHVNAPGDRSSTTAIFETLVRQRTLQLRNYKQALEAANARLMRMAETDPLTDLMNRRRFEEILGEHLERTKETSSSLAVLIADLDDFQSLNDVLGHAIGDQALCLVAHALRSVCRDPDSLARMSGDAFAIAAPGLSPEEAEQLKDRVHAAIRDCRLPGHLDIRLSASVGFAMLAPDVRSAGDLIDRAEQAVLHQKKSRMRAAALVRLPRTG